MLGVIGPIFLGWGMTWLYIEADRGTKDKTPRAGIFLFVVGLDLYMLPYRVLKFSLYVIYVGTAFTILVLFTQR